MTVKNCFLSILNIFLAEMLSLALLSVFSLGYNYFGCIVGDPNNATDTKYISKQFYSTMKEGFSWFRFDKNGYNNIDDTDFSERPIDILLMGSSHMEAVQIAKTKNTGYLLNLKNPNMRTYNIGISGHFFPRCINNLKSAVNYYKPKHFVVMETFTVQVNIDEITAVLNGTFKRDKPRHDTSLAHFFKMIIPGPLLFKDSYSKWKKNSKLIKDKKENTNQILNPESEEYIDAMNKFFSFAKSSLPQNCKMIIFYHPSTNINSDGNYYEVTDKTALSIFENACRSNEIDFVNMSEDFADFYVTEHKLPHGFTNTAIGVGHLNKYGHALIAERLTKEISKYTKGL